MLTHSMDSIQGSDYIAIFISLISLFSGQNLEVSNVHSLGNSYFCPTADFNLDNIIYEIIYSKYCHIIVLPTLHFVIFNFNSFALQMGWKFWVKSHKFRLFFGDFS